MKTLSIVALASLALSVAAQAESIVCRSGQAVASFDRLSDAELAKYRFLKPGTVVYRAFIDEELSSNLIGAVTADSDRLVNVDKGQSNAQTTVLTDWDGNSGIDLSLPTAVLKQPVAYSKGRAFRAELVVSYHDGIDDEQKNTLSCTIEL